MVLITSQSAKLEHHTWKLIDWDLKYVVLLVNQSIEWSLW